MSTQDEQATPEPIVRDGTYLSEDEKVVVVEDGKPARQYDVEGIGWLFSLFS